MCFKSCKRCVCACVCLKNACGRLDQPRGLEHERSTHHARQLGVSGSGRSLCEQLPSVQLRHTPPPLSLSAK